MSAITALKHLTRAVIIISGLIILTIIYALVEIQETNAQSNSTNSIHNER